MKIRIEKKKTVTFNLINNNNLRLKILVVTSAVLKRNDVVNHTIKYAVKSKMMAHGHPCK